MTTLSANNPWVDSVPHGMTVPSHNMSRLSVPHSMDEPSYNPSTDSLPSYTTEADNAELVGDNKDVKNLGLPVLEGWNLKLVVFSLCLGLFLATLETTITATSLVTMASDLGHFDKASWIVVGYLLTYTAFLVVFTRMSDIFGRKISLITATTFFSVWSLACGLSQTIEQLIIFRSLQGIGGSGLYALAVASILDVVPFRYTGHASGAISLASACASVLGPVIGGAITSHTTWRWVFYINVPTGLAVLVLVAVLFPQNIGQQKINRSIFAQIDWPGVLLSLAACILIVFPLEEGGSQFAWNSPIIIALLILSVFAFAAFVSWEWILTKREEVWKMLPIFPTRLVSRRVIGATIATGFFAGFPFMVTIVILPQRLQIVNGLSPVDAGIHILPLLLLTAVGAFVAGIITSKVNCAWYMLLFANGMITLGTGLMSSLPTGHDIPAVNYFYQAMLGFGFGMGLSSLLVLSRCEVPLADNAITVGAITQLRTLGGVIGVSLCQAILLSTLRSQLSSILTDRELASVLLSAEYISLLPADVATQTREVYASATNLEFQAVMGFAIAALLTTFFVYRKDKLDFSAMEDERLALKNGTPLKSQAKKCDSVTDSEDSWSCRSSSSIDKRRISIDDEKHQMSLRERGGSKIAWSLLSHPIPDSNLFHPSELNCPNCGYKIFDSSSV